MVMETFGDMLYYPEAEGLKEFPSPEALKKRVILSTKPPKEYLESKILKDEENGTQKEEKAPVSDDDETWGNEVPDVDTERQYDDKV